MKTNLKYAALALLALTAMALAFQALAITTTTLPDAWAYTVYAPQTLVATGGQTPYTWAVTSGTCVVSAPAAWLVGTPYSAGQTVTYQSNMWLASASSTGVTPGTDPTKWGLVFGLMLSPDGVLTGAPIVGGPCTFTVTVTDALTATASQVYTLNVKGPASSISGKVTISGSVVIH